MMTCETTSASVCDNSRQIVIDLQNGVEGAFDRLYERYSPVLMATLRRRGMSLRDSEDAVQETFLRVSERIEQLDPERSIGGFLKTIAVRIATDMHRKTVRRGRVTSLDVSLDDVIGREEQTEEFVEQSQEFSIAMAILDEQPELTKEIIRLYFFENMTYLQISEQLGIGVTTAKDRVRKAVGTVQQRIVANSRSTT